MRITATGHAGLFIETARGSVLCDPWRSPAYFASWFVFPDNSNITSMYSPFSSVSPERMSYAEGWYAEQSSGDELVKLGDYMVQRRFPHLKADLSRFGTVCDGVLECAMHGWRFELASGRCLTADGDDIVAIAVEDSD